jgi:hypothetical protein
MFVAFLYCLCLLALGTIVPESFIEDFQEQGKAGAPWPFCAYDPSHYSVEVELHDRSKRYANFARPTRID